MYFYDIPLSEEDPLDPVVVDSSVVVKLNS